MLFTKYKLPLIGIFLAIAVLIHYQHGWSQAWYLYVAGVLLLATHIGFGTVKYAFFLLKKGELVKAEQVLQQTLFPDLLLTGHKAYYFFTKGMIALQRKQLDIAAKNLLQAQKPYFVIF